jgi:hypothetical protein
VTYVASKGFYIDRKCPGLQSKVTPTSPGCLVGCRTLGTTVVSKGFWNISYRCSPSLSIGLPYTHSSTSHPQLVCQHTRFIQNACCSISRGSCHPHYLHSRIFLLHPRRLRHPPQAPRARNTSLRLPPKLRYAPYLSPIPQVLQQVLHPKASPKP